MKSLPITLVILLLPLSAYGSDASERVIEAGIRGGISGGAIIAAVYIIRLVFFGASKGRDVIANKMSENRIKVDRGSISKGEIENTMHDSTRNTQVVTLNPATDAKASQEHFALAFREVKDNQRREGLWAMAYANTSNAEDANRQYIKLRAEELYNNELLLKKEEQRLANEKVEARLKASQAKEDQERLEKGKAQAKLEQFKRARKSYDEIREILAEKGIVVRTSVLWKIKVTHPDKSTESLHSFEELQALFDKHYPQ